MPFCDVLARHGRFQLYFKVGCLKPPKPLRLQLLGFEATEIKRHPLHSKCFRDVCLEGRRGRSSVQLPAERVAHRRSGHQHTVPRKNFNSDRHTTSDRTRVGLAAMKSQRVLNVKKALRKVANQGSRISKCYVRRFRQFT